MQDKKLCVYRKDFAELRGRWLRASFGFAQVRLRSTRSIYKHNQTLQVSSFRNPQHHRVVLRRPPALQQPKIPVRIHPGRGHRFQQIRRTHVIRT